MGWEMRHNGLRYLYRNRRVNGKPVKEYLAADDQFGFGESMAHDLDCLQKRESRVRTLKSKIRTAFRRRVDDILATTASANDNLRILAEGILCAVGYHKHHRGEWRMKRKLKQLSGMIDVLK